jgi:predicted RNA-binding protein with RPS1 domain
MDEAVAEKVPEHLLGAAESPLDQNVADRHTTEHDDAAQSTPATPAEETEQTAGQDATTQDAGETPTAETTTEAEPTTHSPDGTEPEPVTAEAVDTSDVAEPVTAEAVDTSDVAEPVTAEAVDTSDVAEPVTAEATETTEAVEDSEPAGASFTPVGEEAEDPSTAGTTADTTESDESDRPRRMQDLEVGMELEGRVTSIALYGVFVDIGVGRDGLVHISEMSETRINSPSDLVQIGDPVKVRVKGTNLDSRRISLTMRSPRESSSSGGGEERRGRRRHEVDRDKLAELKVGEVVEGSVTGLSSFGAFVDIGVGKDGLVHISELSEGRIEKPSDAVQVGETYTFKLLEVDPEGSRISLSLRRAQRLQKMRELSPGQMLEGTVSGLSAFGAFVDIGVGRDGLVHISQLSTDRVEKVEDVVTVGDSVSVRVLEVDPQSKRISLTMRPDTPAEQEDYDMTEGDSSEPTASLAAPVDRPEPQPRRERERQDNREGRRGGKGSGRSGGRSSHASAQQSTGEPYASVGDTDDEEEFSGNATLEDLVMKFGGTYRKDRRRNEYDDEEEGDEEDSASHRQRQRDAIRRTLKHDDEE